MSVTDQVTSKSGATLTCLKDGSGAPIVFVHGVAGDAEAWASLVPPMQEDFTCLRYHRAGRGGSTDPAAFSLDSEIDDLLAVCATAGETPHVVAHSYGGLIALAAASRHVGAFRTLTVYEAPAHFPDAQFGHPDKITGVEQTFETDGPEAAVMYFMANFPRVPPAGIEAMRHAPDWQGRVEGAHTIARELWLAEHFDTPAIVDISADLPVLLFLGETSAPPFQSSYASLRKMIPHARTSVLSGQGHRAMDALPDQMAQTLKEHFDDAR